jgi:hypothetical protein
MRPLVATVLLTITGAWIIEAPVPSITAPDVVRFAVIGDSGTGDHFQYEVAQQLVVSRRQFPFEMVIMLGDNIYGRQEPEDFARKFERPYRPLLDAGVRFYASLGNHDNQQNRFYALFNMGGARYYTFVRQNARFFVLDSDYLDARQVAWLDEALSSAHDDWKICYFHHPLYSDGGRHGSEIDLRLVLEPMFVRHGVNVVFSGHDHIYERLTPQQGIHYFVSGAAGQLRKGDLRPSEITAAAFDQDQSFMLVAIAGTEMSFQAVSRTGKTVDSGVIHREVRR